MRESSGSEHDLADTLVTRGEKEKMEKNATPSLEDAIIVETAISPSSKRPSKGNKARQLKKLIEVTRDINTNQTNINFLQRNLPAIALGNPERSNNNEEPSDQKQSAKSFEAFSNMQLKKHMHSETGLFSKTPRSTLHQSKSREICKKTGMLSSRASIKPHPAFLVSIKDNKLNASLEHFPKRGASQGA